MNPRQPSLTEQVAYGIIVLLGEENKDWEYPETDPEWWAVHLFNSQN